MNTNRAQVPPDICKALDRIKKTRHLEDDLGKVIRYFYSSIDITPLCSLLESADENVLSDGLYILSEIGKSGIPLRYKIKKFLKHSDVQIRYWSMNSVVSCFPGSEAKEIIEDADLLNDSDDFVRARAREMLDKLRK